MPVIQILLAGGASPETVDKEGKTALDRAIQTGDRKVIDALGRSSGARRGPQTHMESFAPFEHESASELFPDPLNRMGAKKTAAEG